jgi:hypothetical protein
MTKANLENDVNKNTVNDVVEAQTTSPSIQPLESNAEGNQEVINEKPGVITDEPQDPEHMHMALLGQSTSLRDAYVPVSDDRGEILGNKELEEKVIKYTDDFLRPQKESPDKRPEDLLAELKTISIEYAKKINISTCISDGAFTKYRIRLGLLFRYQKTLVRKAGLEWIKWFSENYDEKHLRSIQDYMSLAEIPNIIRYAVFGKERLTELRRVFPQKKFKQNEDPVGDFLKKHHILFDPESDNSMDSWRALVDAALTIERIEKLEENEEVELNADPEIIKALVAIGASVDNGMLREMVIVSNSGGNVNEYLRRRYVNGGAEESIIINSRMLEGLPKLVARFKDTVDYLKEHKDLIEKLKRKDIIDLEEQLTELKALIN